ncbi:MAG: hypothetical protein OXH68_19035 [Gammaproteobacteria bacterium]|nr:hypothetical protein [Gammaproteobacteria bacterium]
MALAGAGAARAQTTFVSNLENGSLSNSCRSPFDGTSLLAQPFHTGGDDGDLDFELHSVDIKFYQIFGTTQIAVSIWTTDGNGTPRETLERRPDDALDDHHGVVQRRLVHGGVRHDAVRPDDLRRGRDRCQSTGPGLHHRRPLRIHGRDAMEHLVTPQSTSNGNSWSNIEDPLPIAVKGTVAATSTDATLSGLALADAEGNAVSPNETFDSETTTYTATAANAVPSTLHLHRR